jgi:Protein of unknown function (DUF3455)
MTDDSSTERRSRFRFGLAVLAVAFTFVPSRPARAERVVAPPVPIDIRVPAGNKAFLKGHAIGTQNYICLPSGGGVAWTLFGPQATLFDDHGKQIMTHFLSANPAEAGLPRPTWQHSRDTSSVWAFASKQVPGAAGAIPWLLLQAFPGQAGPTGGRTLTKTTYIQRLNTTGGAMPSTGCAVAADIGKKALVPYTADYFFFKDSDDDDDEDED